MFTLLKLKLRAIAILGITIASIYLVSCQEDATTPQVQVDREKLSRLVDNMYAEADDPQIDIVLKEYQSLSPEEFEVYETLKLEKDRKAFLVKRDGQQGELEMSEARVDAEIESIKELRTAANSEAHRQFGKSFNQLTGDEMNAVVRKFEGTSQPTGKVDGCTDYNYPLSANAAWGWGTGWYGWWWAEPDCDYEFRFDGWYNRIKCRTPSSRTLLASFGDHTSRRLLVYNDGTDTAILLGSIRTSIIVGSPYSVAIGMTWE